MPREEQLHNPEAQSEEDCIIPNPVLDRLNNIDLRLTKLETKFEDFKGYFSRQLEKLDSRFWHVVGVVGLGILANIVVRLLLG